MSWLCFLFPFNDFHFRFFFICPDVFSKMAAWIFKTFLRMIKNWKCLKVLFVFLTRFHCPFPLSLDIIHCPNETLETVKISPTTCCWKTSCVLDVFELFCLIRYNFCLSQDVLQKICGFFFFGGGRFASSMSNLCTQLWHTFTLRSINMLMVCTNDLQRTYVLCMSKSALTGSVRSSNIVICTCNCGSCLMFI